VAQRAGLGVAHLGFVGAGFNLFAALLLANVRLLEKTLGLSRLLLLTRCSLPPCSSHWDSYGGWIWP